MNNIDIIKSGKAVLGIEFGSTRIKAVLISPDHKPLASGDFIWENRLEDGIWTYHIDEIWLGLSSCYNSLCSDVMKKYGVEITNLASIGISAMMHGYLAFDKNDNLLTPYRTWRNTTTQKASDILSKALSFNIPQRWSSAHLYQSILDNDSHLADLNYLTTLAGYVHWKLTGERVIGIGDASGMFPIDTLTSDFDEKSLEIFEELAEKSSCKIDLESILPKVLTAGKQAGYLTQTGIKLLDSSGKLSTNIPLCPPEGDAGTGMVATNSLKAKTGNVSAGTSIFAMIVLKKKLANWYPEIDIVTTPTGSPVAMIHCNNCTSDINAWASLLGETAKLLGAKFDTDTLYTTLYKKALDGDSDCGNLVSCNYLSGESITGFSNGIPLFARLENSNFNLGNFMKSHIFSAIATLKIGMDSACKNESIEIDSLVGHGGFFKTKGTAQNIMSSALNLPISVTETASEGGAWGIAVLAAFILNNNPSETLEDYLDNKVFSEFEYTTTYPNEKENHDFDDYMKKYNLLLSAEETAVSLMIN